MREEATFSRRHVESHRRKLREFIPRSTIPRLEAGSSVRKLDFQLET